MMSLEFHIVLEHTVEVRNHTLVEMRTTQKLDLPQSPPSVSIDRRLGVSAVCG